MDQRNLSNLNFWKRIRRVCKTLFLHVIILHDACLTDKQCILTITRPNGDTRSYKSSSGLSRRGDAKAEAAKIAVEMGAIEFIASGSVNALGAKGRLLNPINVDIDSMELDEIATAAMQKFAQGELLVKQIEQCCEEWRLGQVKPHWVSFYDSKGKKR